MSERLNFRIDGEELAAAKAKAQALGFPGISEMSREALRFYTGLYPDPHFLKVLRLQAEKLNITLSFFVERSLIRLIATRDAAREHGSDGEVLHEFMLLDGEPESVKACYARIFAMEDQRLEQLDQKQDLEEAKWKFTDSAKQAKAEALRARIPGRPRSRGNRKPVPESEKSRWGGPSKEELAKWEPSK